jgi:hypothetical protein
MTNHFAKVTGLIPPWIRGKIPARVKNWWRARRQVVPSPLFDLGCPNLVETAGRSKRALVSYLTKPFRLLPNDPLNLLFSNIGIARSIVQVLDDLGYIVDIVEWKDTKFIPDRHYDLFIGHGGHNFERITRNLSLRTIKIHFSSGS